MLPAFKIIMNLEESRLCGISEELDIQTNEIDPHKYNQLFFDKCKSNQWSKDSHFNTWFWINWTHF